MIKITLASCMAPVLLFVTRYFDADKLLIFAVGVIILVVTLVFDFFTGIAASKKEGDKIKSSKGTEGVFKFATYIIVLFLMLLMQMAFIQAGIDNYLVSILDYLRLSFLILMILWELHSIGENFQRKFGYKPKLFYLLEKLIAFFEKYVIGLFSLVFNRVKQTNEQISNKEIKEESKEDIQQTKIPGEET